MSACVCCVCVCEVYSYNKDKLDMARTFEEEEDTCMAYEEEDTCGSCII